MRKAMLVINPETLTPELKNVFVEVEKEEIEKGMRPYEKSSDKIKRKRILKVYNRWNDPKTNRKGIATQTNNFHDTLHRLNNITIKKSNNNNYLIFVYICVLNISFPKTVRDTSAIIKYP